MLITNIPIFCNPLFVSVIGYFLSVLVCRKPAVDSISTPQRHAQNQTTVSMMSGNGCLYSLLHHQIY